MGDREALGAGEWNRRVGALGETLAAKYLRRQGCKVLYRNFKARHGGEVDIVCRDGDTLVFTEVKTRTSSGFLRPSAAVDTDKERLIIRAALEWLRLLNKAPEEIHYRFDIVEVILEDGSPPRLERIEGAFTLPDGYRI